MCGFVGWVNTEKDLMNERETIDKMTATLSRRGPDDSGIYMSRSFSRNSSKNATWVSFKT